MRQRIDGYRLLAVAVAMAVVFGVLLLFGLPAEGRQCEKFRDHSGHVPAGWTATFIEDGKEYEPVVGPGYLNPKEAGRWNKSWDKAIKCRTKPTPPPTDPTTTTTAPTTTTTEAPTSTPPSTTTTEPTSTTTISPPTTNTTPTTTPPAESTTTPPPSTVPDESASFFASAGCDGPDGFISALWADGISAVDVYYWVTGLPNIEDGWEHVTRWTEPGRHPAQVASASKFLLVPVTVTGFTATEVTVTVESCNSQASSTSLPEAPETPVFEPNDPPVDELPHTGLSVTWGILVGAFLVASGTALVRRARA